MINSDSIRGSVSKQGTIAGNVKAEEQISGTVTIGSNPLSSKAVLFVEQSLTDEQAEQARRNIKAVGENVEGVTFVPYTVEEIDGYNYNFHYEEPVVAQEGAEIFNDYTNISAGLWSTASGYQTQAIGNYSIANGWWTRADGQCAVASGLLTRASGHFTHAEGTRTLASINNAHAEGDLTQATGRQSHAEGVQTIASGYCAHAEGSNTKATNYYSHAEGLGTISAGRNQTTMGKYNISDTKSLVIVGNGSKDTTRSNAYKLDANGNGWFEGTVASTGADYAEYFEWVDGNPNGEDRIGRVVTLEGEKIRYANENDYVLGIISGTALVLGDNPGDEWKEKFLKDEYGRFLTETVEDFVEYYDYETGENVVESTGFVERKVLNPAFNPEDEYITRKERNEWDIVGMMGKIHVIDDGTCVPNGYAKVSHDGIVTHSDKVTTMRVMERVSENIVWILKKTANDGDIDEEQVIDIVNNVFEEGKLNGDFVGPQGPQGEPGQSGYTPVKGVDYFDGKDGYTPQKNIDYFDGKDGKDGKTPVKGEDYFTPAEVQAIAEQAAEMVDVPSADPVTMQPLTFTGAVNATYDGSAPVSVEIPQGGGGGSAKAWRKISEFTLEEDCTSATWFSVNNDSDGSELDLVETLVIIRAKTDGSNGNLYYQAYKYNGWNANYVVMNLTVRNNSKIVIHSEAIAGEGFPAYIRTTYAENTNALATKATGIGMMASDIALDKIRGANFQMPSGTLAGTTYEFWGVDR